MTFQEQTTRKRRIIKKIKKPVEEKPKEHTPRKRIIKKKKKSSISLNNNANRPNVNNTNTNNSDLMKSNTYSRDDNDEVVVYVKPWRCSSNNIYYLLDPITHEVFDKLTHEYIGIRYKDEDEVSLIDYS